MSLLGDCQCHRCAGMKLKYYTRYIQSRDFHSSMLHANLLAAYIDQPNLSAFLKLPALSVLQIVYSLAMKALESFDKLEF